VLVLLGILFLLGHFVTVFAEIHEPADRRRGGGGDLDEVNPVLPREIDRVVQRMTPSCLPSTPMTRTSRARILPLTRTNEAGEKLRGAKGRLKTPSSVVA
jgi:hypothetical protein